MTHLGNKGEVGKPQELVTSANSVSWYYNPHCDTVKGMSTTFKTPVTQITVYLL